MKNNLSGYVLLETLVGVGIIGVVMVSSLYVFSESVRSLEEIKKQTVAVTLAQKMMEEISAADSCKDTDTGNFSPDYPEYNWQVASTSVEQNNNYNLTNVKLTVS